MRWLVFPPIVNEIFFFAFEKQFSGVAPFAANGCIVFFYKVVVVDFGGVVDLDFGKPTVAVVGEGEGVGFVEIAELRG